MRMPRIAACTAFAMICLTAGTLTAQMPTEAERDTTRFVELDPMIVSVSHLEVLRSRVPSSVSVVTREDIRESGAASVLTAVSDQVPGVFINQRGVLGYGVAQGAAGNITIRGVGSSPNTQVLVMTDGRPQMMGLFGHPLADTHVSSGVERVEVIRGPASVLYGTSAMGGVINIITRRDWAPGLEVGAGASYGTFDTQRQELWLSYGASARSGITVAGNRYRTDGHRPMSDFAIDNLTVRGSAELRPGLSLVADAAISDLNTFDPGPVTTAPQDPMEAWVDVTRSSAGVTLENRGARFSGVTGVFYNAGRHEIFDGFHSRDHTLGVRMHQGMVIGDGTLTVGADFKRYGGEAENTLGGMDWGSHEVDEYGVFALVHHPLPANIAATGGVRVSHHSAYGVEMAPQMGVAIPLGTGTTLRASSARGFRSPTIRELHLFPAPNPDLEPERAWNNEVGLLQRIGDRTSLEVVVFRVEGANLIRTTGSFPNLVLSNSGDFVHHGAEMALSTAPTANLRLDGSYGYLDPGAMTGGHPRHQLHGAARYSFGRATANLSAQHVAGLYADDDFVNELPSYTLLNARLAYDLPRGLTAHISADNLLDADYEIVPAYPMPGRTLSVGLQLGGH